MTKVPTWIALEVQRDIDNAIERKDPQSLRNFALEARNSGMVEAATRAFEVASLIESWIAKEKRAELLRIKAASPSRPARREPTQAELVRRFDAEQMASGSAPFSVNTHEENERRRCEEQNRQLHEKQRRSEEQRRAHVVENERPRGPGWRR